MKKASKAQIIAIMLLLLTLCACNNKEKTAESPNASAEPSIEATETPDIKGEDPAGAIETPDTELESPVQDTEIPTEESPTPTEVAEPPAEETEAPSPKPTEEAAEPSNSYSEEKTVLYWSFTEDAPAVDIVGHYADDWGFPVSVTIYVESGTVKDFCIVSFKTMEESVEGVMFEVDEVLLDVGELTSGQGVVAEVYLGEFMPVRGLAFREQDGTAYVYSWGESGEDGSIYLYQDMIKQDY